MLRVILINVRVPALVPAVSRCVLVRVSVFTVPLPPPPSEYVCLCPVDRLQAPPPPRCQRSNHTVHDLIRSEVNDHPLIASRAKLTRGAPRTISCEKSILPYYNISSEKAAAAFPAQPPY